jgi:subtilisin family serine protease
VCPEADLVTFRIADSQGTVLESDLLDSLDALLALLSTPVEKGGLVVDVLNLSLGFFHETPEDGLFEHALGERLVALRRLGCAVVCSAGNAATDRPSFPAALWAWDDAEFTVEDPGAGAAPHVSVGALNPNGTVALFSNIGRWVRAYAPGVGVLSSSPPFRGGVQPGSRQHAGGLRRETIDPDDFSGGYAVWSGTSFAAPYVAGRLAASIIDKMMDGKLADVAARGRALHKALTDLEPELAKLREVRPVDEP